MQLRAAGRIQTRAAVVRTQTRYMGHPLYQRSYPERCPEMIFIWGSVILFLLYNILYYSPSASTDFHSIHVQSWFGCLQTALGISLYLINLTLLDDHPLNQQVVLYIYIVQYSIHIVYSTVQHFSKSEVTKGFTGERKEKEGVNYWMCARHQCVSLMLHIAH